LRFGHPSLAAGSGRGEPIVTRSALCQLRLRPYPMIPSGTIQGMSARSSAACTHSQRDAWRLFVAQLAPPGCADHERCTRQRARHRAGRDRKLNLPCSRLQVGSSAPGELEIANRARALISTLSTPVIVTNVRFRAFPRPARASVLLATGLQLKHSKVATDFSSKALHSPARCGLMKEGCSFCNCVATRTGTRVHHRLKWPIRESRNQIRRQPW